MMRLVLQWSYRRKRRPFRPAIASSPTQQISWREGCYAGARLTVTSGSGTHGLARPWTAWSTRTHTRAASRTAAVPTPAGQAARGRPADRPVLGPGGRGRHRVRAGGRKDALHRPRLAARCPGHGDGNSAARVGVMSGYVARRPGRRGSSRPVHAQNVQDPHRLASRGRARNIKGCPVTTAHPRGRGTPPSRGYPKMSSTSLCTQNRRTMINCLTSSMRRRMTGSLSSDCRWSRIASRRGSMAAH